MSPATQWFDEHEQVGRAVADVFIVVTLDASRCRGDRRRDLADELPDDEYAVLVWDHAGFHTAGKIKVPPNVTLLRLPPYSPQLNPVENLWHYLKSHPWGNRFHDDYDALMAAACEAWDRVSIDAELIKSVCVTPPLAKRAD